jgi:hypothetical protein
MMKHPAWMPTAKTMATLHAVAREAMTARSFAHRWYGVRLLRDKGLVDEADGVLVVTPKGQEVIQVWGRLKELLQ